MIKHEYERDTIITAERGKFLKLANQENSVELVGKPHRIIFSNEAPIPEFVEEPIQE